MRPSTASSTFNELDQLAPAALGEELVAIGRELDALQSRMIPLAYRFSKAGLWNQAGWRTAADWMASHCRMTAGAAAELIGMGERFWQLSLAEAALIEGSICFRNAVLMYRLAEQVGYRLVVPMEADLVEQARQLSPGNFARLLHHFRGMLDAEGLLEDARLAHQRRYLQLAPTIDGIYYLKGKFDPDAGAAIEAALVALSPRRGLDDMRTPGNRRADALLDLVRMALDSGELPEIAGERPHVTLTVSAEALAGVPGSMPPRLGHDIPVPVQTAHRLLCDSLVTLIPIDRIGNPLNVGRTRRTISARQRKALNARDRGCCFPGCDRPWWWTDAHHLVPGGWAAVPISPICCSSADTTTCSCMREGGPSAGTTTATGSSRSRPNAGNADRAGGVGSVLTVALSRVRSGLRGGSSCRSHRFRFRSRTTPPPAATRRPSTGR